MIRPSSKSPAWRRARTLGLPTMTVDVRTVTEAEFPAWVAALRAGFLGHAAEGEAE